MSPATIFVCLTLVASASAKSLRGVDILKISNHKDNIPSGAEYGTHFAHRATVSVPVPEQVRDVLGAWGQTGTCKSPKVIASGCGAVATLIEPSVSSTGFSTSSFFIKAGGTAADVVRASSFNTSGLFEIASNTKLFTALLTEILITAGSLSADHTTLGSIFPASTQYKCRYTPLATLRQLSTHTAGFPAIPNNFQDLDKTSADYNPFAYYTHEVLLRWLTTLPCCDPQEVVPKGNCLGVHNTQAKGTKVREAFYYSNVAFGMLGYILEEKTGSSLNDLYKEHIFQPLGMNQTTLPPASNLILGHNASGGRQNRVHPYGVLQGQGALLSNIHDMSLWLEANLQVAQGTPPQRNSLYGSMFRIMQPRYTDDVQTAASFGNMGRVGMAWQELYHNGHLVEWKSGGTEGFSSFTTFDATKSKALVAFDNCGGCGLPPPPSPNAVESTSDGLSATHSAAVQLLGLGDTYRQEPSELRCAELVQYVGQYAATIAGQLAWEASIELSDGCKVSNTQQQKDEVYLIMHTKVQKTNAGFLVVPANQNGGVGADSRFRLDLAVALDKVYPIAARFVVTTTSNNKSEYSKIATFQYSTAHPSSERSPLKSEIAKLVWSNDGYDTTLVRHGEAPEVTRRRRLKLHSYDQ